MGTTIALIAAAMVVVLTGFGASIGVMWVQQAAAGVIGEEPEKYGKTLVLQLVPTTSALYGFVIAFLILLNTVLGTDGGIYSTDQGLHVLIACLPIALVGFLQTMLQARVCVACVNMIGKNGELSGRALTMAIFSEIFTLFAFIVSILSVLRIGS